MTHTPDTVKVEGQTVIVHGKPMTRTSLEETIGHLREIREPPKAVQESIKSYEKQLAAMEAAGGTATPSD